jgi:integrase
MAKAKALHNRPVAAITRRDIAELLSATEVGVTKGIGAATANHLRSILSACFAWAMREGLCESNPVVATNKRAQGSRDRVLSICELVDVWRVLPADNFGAASKLLMLTGQRRNEAGGIRWSELNADLTLWTLPASRSKNKREHLVPVSEPARRILAQCYHVVGQDCLFSTSDGIANWGHYKADLDEKLPGMSHWTLHDIRRSVATHMAERLQIQPHIIEAILNHANGHKAGVAGVYNRATYLAEKTAALTLWAEHLMAAVSGEPAKVVPLLKVG